MTFSTNRFDKEDNFFGFFKGKKFPESEEHEKNYKLYEINKEKEQLNDINSDRYFETRKYSIFSRVNSDDRLKSKTLKKIEFSLINSKEEIYNKISSFTEGISYEQHLNFLFFTLPKDQMISCRIIKVSDNLIGKFYPVYLLYLEINDKLLMTAKKIYKTTSTTYNIYFKDESECIGKLSSNFLGTEFNLFDSGRKHDVKGDLPLRLQYACIQYGVNILGFKGPRKMKVFLPKLSEGETIRHQPQNPKEYLQNLNKRSTLTFLNKPPVWDECK